MNPLLQIPQNCQAIVRISALALAIISPVSVVRSRADTATAPSRLLLSGFEDPLASDWAMAGNGSHLPFELSTAPAKVKDGKGSAQWSDVVANPWLNLLHCPPDWSAYEAVSIWIYAEKANSQVLNFTATSPGANATGDYYIYQLTIDWTGWRQVIIPFDRFRSIRNPAGWNAIRSFGIASKGWGQVQPLPDTVLYLDELELIRR